MKIDWLGHSCFRFTESTGTTIIADPYNRNKSDLHCVPLTADAVTCSHPSEHHSFASGIGGQPIIIDQQGSYEIKGVHIEGIATEEEPKHNLAFCYRMDGVDICHLGNILGKCTPELIEEITPVDVLLLPIGGNDLTIDAETAMEYIDLLMPEIVIPMHYRNDRGDNDHLDSLKDFLRLVDDELVLELKEGVSLELERDDFDGRNLKIIVPEIYRG